MEAAESHRIQVGNETQLRKMTAEDIITREVEPSPWVSLLTYHHKANETLRVCLDPKDLNKATICEYLKSPTLEVITYRLAGLNTYSQI